jgi:hypothetical protein
MTALNAARERTDHKSRYAGVHLAELMAQRLLQKAQGTDWERAHQESFLYHLLGVRDALLQEINLFHVCGLSMDQVRKQALVARLGKQGANSPALDTLLALEADAKSWLSIAGRLRHFSTHQKNVPQQYYVGGDRHDRIFLRDPLGGEPIEIDYVEMFSQWLENMRQLVTQVRAAMPGAENA